MSETAWYTVVKTSPWGRPGDRRELDPDDPQIARYAGIGVLARDPEQSWVTEPVEDEPEPDVED